MPTVYLAGTAVNNVYPGVPVSTPTALLTELKNAFTAAGQTVTDEIATNNRIIARGVDQGDFCDKIYTVPLVNGVEYALTVKGDNVVNGGTAFATGVSIPFFANGNAKLFLAADAGGECISVFNPGATTRGLHAGWLENRRLADKGAWMIGLLDVWMTGAYFAKDIHGANWREVRTFYYNSTEAFATPVGPYQFLWDIGVSSSSGATVQSPGANVFNYKPWQGQADLITGEAILLPYGYLQGASASNTYPTTVTNTNLGQSLHNPGFVRFARTGLAFADAGDQCKQGTATFVSAGSSGANAFQGFQIAS